MTDLATIGFRADTSGLTKAEQGLDRVADAGKRTDTSLTALQKTVGIVGTALAAIGSAQIASQLAKLADTATNIENKLRSVTSSTEQLASAQERLLKIANSTRSEYQTTVELYTKLSKSTTELGLSSERLFRITETINKSFVASGASADEASNAIRQLAQGLSAGALRGDEFNSVAEQAPEILRAVAAQTGKTVGELREFAAQGGITAKVLIASLENYGDTVDKVYGKTNATLEQSRTIAANNVIEWVAGNKTIMSATAAFGAAMVAVSENLDAVGSAIQAAAAVIGAAMLPALAKYITGLYAAVTATGALSAATSFLLGPCGLLIAAVGAGAAAFYMTSSAQKEMTATTKVLDSDIDKLTKSMEGMTKAQRDSLTIDINKRLLDIQKEADAMKELIKTRQAVAGFSNEEVAEFGKLIGVAGLNTESLAAAATHGEAKIDSLDERSAELTATLKQLAEMGGKAGKAVAGMGESAEKTAEKISKLDESMDEYTEAAIFLNDNETWRAFDQGELIQEMQDELDGLNGKVKEYASISEKAAERIEQAFADAWLNAFDGFESVVDGMKNAFKRMLAEMAHMALTRPIMVSMGLGGMLPGAAGAATGAATGGAMAGLGLLGGIGGGFIGAGGMIGGAFGSGLMGGGALLGAGQFGTMFSGAGSLLGSGNIMAGLGMAMPLILGAGAALAGIQKLSGGGLFGTSYSTTGQSLGLSLSGGDVSGSITTEESRKRSLFRGTKRRTTTTGYDASAIDDAFDAITGALSESAKMFGITGADEIIKGFSAAANIDIKGKSEAEVQAAIQEWVGNTTAGLVNAVFGDSLEGLQKEGEGVIDTVNRLSMNMTAVQSITKTLGLGFDLTGKAAMIASTNIVELAGGIDQLSALTSQYYASFYSEAEQQQNLATQLAAEFEKLNVTMPMTREGFRSLVDGLDLTTESGQAAFAALMQLVPGMDQYLTALEAQRTASEQAAEAAQKEAEAKAAALKAQGLDLQLRLYEALGQSSEALAMRRQMELEATDETLRALLLQIYAAEDAAAAQRELAAAQEAAARLMQQRQSLEIQLLEATGQSAQATALRRQLELESMDESLRGLQQSIWTAQDAAVAQEALAQAQAEAAEAAKDLAQNAFGKLQEAAEREKGRMQTELDSKLEALQTERDAIEQQQKDVIAGYQAQGQAIQDYISRLEGLNGVINNFLADTGSAVDPFKRLGQIFNEVKAGLLPDQAELSSVLSGIQSAGSASFGSATDQQRAMAIARNQAAGIGSSVSGALSGAVSQQRQMQTQIDNANAYYASQLARLDTAAESAQKYHDEQVALIDKQLADAEKQLNALLNIDDRILSMTDALAEFYAAMSGAGAPQVVAASTVSEAVATAAVEQVEAIERVEAAIIDIAAELIEFNKPDDRVWVPPTMPDRYTTDGVPMSTEMIDLLNKILSAQESTAKHTAKTADTLQRVEMDGLDTRTVA